MRDDQEMLDLILNTARQDERVRAVILNGSRVNPNAPHDRFQDFDIIYLVTDVAAFKADPTWIDCFGERMILQLPDDMVDPPPEPGFHYAYLMQFADGNRIDLSLYPLDRLSEMGKDSLSVLLLDKAGVVPPFPPPDESSYLPQPPSAKAYFDCCNEFWWVCPYAAKGLWRKEILYAKYMLDTVIRDELTKMLCWYIGVQTDFKLNPGKFGKYFKRYLTAEQWQLLEKTYADADYEHTWQALFCMGELFRSIAVVVGNAFGYAYLQREDAAVTAYLREIHDLPQDAGARYG
jgi:aminoglycoside 6-adenylyltransferase